MGAGFAGKLGTLGGEDAVGGFAAGEGFIEKLGAVVGNARGEKVALPRRGGVGAAAQGIERLRKLRRARTYAAHALGQHARERPRGLGFHALAVQGDGHALRALVQLRVDVRAAEFAQDSLGTQGIQGFLCAYFVDGVALGKRLRRLCAVEARGAANDARKRRRVVFLQRETVFILVFARDPQSGLDVDGAPGDFQRVHPFRGRAGFSGQQVSFGKQPRVQLVRTAGRARRARRRLHGFLRGRERQKRFL